MVVTASVIYCSRIICFPNIYLHYCEDYGLVNIATIWSHTNNNSAESVLTSSRFEKRYFEASYIAKRTACVKLWIMISAILSMREVFAIISNIFFKFWAISLVGESFELLILLLDNKLNYYVRLFTSRKGILQIYILNWIPVQTEIAKTYLKNLCHLILKS